MLSNKAGGKSRHPADSRWKIAIFKHVGCVLSTSHPLSHLASKTTIYV